MEFCVDWSLLLADRDWITKFHSRINRVIDVAQALNRARSVSALHQSLVESDWVPAICDLKARVQQAVDDALDRAREAPESAIDATGPPEVVEAFNLVFAALDAWCPPSEDFETFAIPWKPHPDFVSTLENAAKLLTGWFKAPEGEPATVDASGDKAPATNKARPPRGSLDERTVIELKRSPAATYKQLAAALGFECRPGTLRDKKKCPLLAQAKAIIEAQREIFRQGSTWRDRRPDDDEP